MVFRGFLMLICAAVLQAQTATPPINLVRSYTSPPIGLGATETASITVVNTTTFLTPSAISAVPVCTGTITFLNASGAIGTATSFSLTPGQFKTVALPFSSAGLTGIRGEIRGEVSAALPVLSSLGCSLVLSLETYDSTTGATHFVLSSSLMSLFVGPVVPVVAQ